MEQHVDTVGLDEAIFEIQELPGPAFALKQQGDVARVVPAQVPETRHQ